MTPASLAGIIVLGLAVHRAWRLVAIDDLPWLVRARRAFLGLSDHPTGVLHVRRPVLKKWLECPWCSGAWLTVIGYVAWRWAPSVAEPALVLLAASSVAGIIVRNLDPTED